MKARRSGAEAIRAGRAKRDEAAADQVRLGWRLADRGPVVSRLVRFLRAAARRALQRLGRERAWRARVAGGGNGGRLFRGGRGAGVPVEPELVQRADLCRRGVVS